MGMLCVDALRAVLLEGRRPANAVGEPPRRDRVRQPSMGATSAGCSCGAPLEAGAAAWERRLASRARRREARRRSTRRSASSSRRRAPRSSSPSTTPGNPDAIYTYDPTLVGGEGAVLLLPGKEGRRREPEATVATLERRASRSPARVELPATVEGGDTVWLDEQTLLVGIGYRTNPAALGALADGVARRRGDRLRPPSLERRRRGDAPHVVHLAARPRPRASSTPASPRRG